jgi:membrane protein involved in colicin uptake
MQGQWERALGRMREEAPRLREEARRAPQRAQAKAEEWKREAEHAVHGEHHEQRPHEAPRFRT